MFRFCGGSFYVVGNSDGVRDMGVGILCRRLLLVFPRVFVGMT